MSEPTHARNQIELAKALGVSQATVSRLRKKPGAPEKTAEGHPVQAWREHAETHRQRRSRIGYRATPKAPTPPAGPGEVTKAEQTALKHLEESRDRREHAEAVEILCAAELARLRRASGGINRETVSAWKQAAEEARRTVKAEADAAKDTGQLVERAALKASMGALGRIVLEAHEQLSSDIATKVQLWATDPGFAAKSSAEQRAEVQEWARLAMNGFRRALVEEELDAIVTQACGG